MAVNVLTLLKPVFAEEVGKLKQIIERRDPADYEDYKRVRHRMQFLVELVSRFAQYSRPDRLVWAMHWLIEDQTDFENTIKEDPFTVNTKGKVDREQLWFYFKARANAH